MPHQPPTPSGSPITANATSAVKSGADPRMTGYTTLSSPWRYANATSEKYTACIATDAIRNAQLDVCGTGSSTAPASPIAPAPTESAIESAKWFPPDLMIAFQTACSRAATRITDMTPSVIAASDECPGDGGQHDDEPGRNLPENEQRECGKPQREIRRRKN